jgi:2-C-methyl-D-erythritol 2,4-cyclodiphosphate synthase
MAYKGADSKVLLKKAYELITSRGYQLVNLDSTVILEKPKLRPYIDQMRSAIAELLSVEADVVSIKATTNEKMGFLGRSEGCVAMATVLIQKIQ